MHRGDSRRGSWDHIVQGAGYHREGELQERHEQGHRSGEGLVGERGGAHKHVGAVRKPRRRRVHESRGTEEGDEPSGR